LGLVDGGEKTGREGKTSISEIITHFEGYLIGLTGLLFLLCLY